MANLKIMNLLALSSLALLFCSFGVTPASAAIGDHHPVHIARGHDAIAKRRRYESVEKRCKARSPPSTTPVTPAVTSSSASSSKQAEATSSAKADNSKTDSSKTDTKSSDSGSGAAQTNYTPSKGSNGKYCLGMNGGALDDPVMKYWKSDRVSSYHNWYAAGSQAAQEAGFSYMSTFWGDKSTGDFSKLVVNKPSAPVDAVLGYNEPDISGQSHTSPENAAAKWWQYVNNLKDRSIPLVSPAVTSNDNGIAWLRTFFDNCKGCAISAVAVHIYTVDADYFTSFVDRVHKEFGLPVWVTETACHDFSGKSCANVYDFMSKIMAYADQTSYLEKLCWFGALDDAGMYNVNHVNQLMGSDRKPNALGKFFLYG